MSASLRERLILIVALGFAALAVFYVGLRMYNHWDLARQYGWGISDGYCNIAVVPVQGTIVPYDSFWSEGGESGTETVNTTGDSIAQYIRAAEADRNIAGVLLKVDSFGGAASPAETAMNAIERTPLPTVAYIREAGASAAYLVSSAADHIVASPFAAVGSIGVTYSYVDQVEKNRKEGLHFVQLSSGPYKDTGDPNKPLSEDEVALYERDLSILHTLFVDLVAKNRGLDPVQVAAIADGSTMPGALALENGLVDAVGDEEAAKQWFAQQLNLAPQDIVLCE
jgi:signal peptide peptidase SppA